MTNEEHVDAGAQPVATSERTSEDHVRVWLAKSGTRLEMQVADQLFQVGALDVQQARVYQNDEDKLREIDVVAWFSSTSGGSYVETVLSVECKASRDTPWVVLQRPRRQLPTKDTAVVETFYVTLYDDEPGLTQLHHGGLFRWHHPEAYAVETAYGEQKGRKDQRNSAWDACRQAVSGAAALSEELAKVDEQGDGHPTARIVVPVVVTAAPLVQVAYAGGGAEPTVHEINWTLLLTRVLAGDDINGLWIVQADSFDSFCESARESVTRVTR